MSVSPSFRLTVSVFSHIYHHISHVPHSSFCTSMDILSFTPTDLLECLIYSLDLCLHGNVNWKNPFLIWRYFTATSDWLRSHRGTFAWLRNLLKNKNPDPLTYNSLFVFMVGQIGIVCETDIKDLRAQTGGWAELVHFIGYHFRVRHSPCAAPLPSHSVFLQSAGLYREKSHCMC
jgi:hypothetical protein